VSPPDEVDEGWDEGGGDEAGESDEAAPATPGAPVELGPDGQPRRKRRRRRRGRGERGPAPQGQPSGGAPPAEHALQGDPYAAGAPAPPRPPQQPRQPQQPRPPQPQRPPQQQQRPRNEQRPQRNRGDRRRDDGPPVDLVEDDVQAQNDLRTRAEDAAAAPVPGSSVGGALRRNDARRDDSAKDDDEDDVAPTSTEAWGTDDGSPAPAIALVSELPADPPASDPDPSTFTLLEEPGAKLGEDVASVVGVRFVPAGRITWFDASDADYMPGERVLVDAERGGRLGWVATVTVRRGTRDRGLRRVLRRANEQDLRGETATDENRVRTLRMAKDAAAALRLPLKVFRVEVGNGKLLVYYTSDERMDLRDFVRDISQSTGMRPELRQLGVRDEAKAVGGIGSCGLTLCCTTWLPEFVPVSIKMAKDQGLVLSPTKVSGQCGRLKCCLVYEQAAYAELRKGLPKLGKRVIGVRGEGRVVEVDVLRQRVRVSYGAGDTEVVAATEVKPLFPAGNQPARERDRGGRPGPPPDLEPDEPDETAADEEDLDDGPPDPSRDPNAED
jgi:cell fate regulator YaaT (PSP1 superfamily)